MATYVIDNRRQVIDFENSTDMIARTIQNCKNLLMTQMGEVRMTDCAVSTRHCTTCRLTRCGWRFSRS